MAKKARVERNPLDAPRVAGKKYRLEDFRIRVDKCKACGEPVEILGSDLYNGRYVVCSCGKGAFEVEVRLVHTIEA